MPVIGLLNQKGGAGKTTASLNVAAELAARDARVLLIDADPQGSAVDWAAARGERSSPFVVVRFDRPNLHKQVAAMALGYDYVIIDGPARDAVLQRSALLACHLVAVPVQPSGLDLWSSGAFLALAEEARPFAPKGQRTAILTSRGSARGVLAREVREALGAHGLPVLDGLAERTAYREAVTGAMTIHELAALSGSRWAREARAAARDEVAALTTALLTLEETHHA